MDNYPIKISKFKDDGFLPHGLRFSISKLHKIDEHLYSFQIKHPTKKYLTFNEYSCRQANGVDFQCIEMVDDDRDFIEREDYITGKVKGGLIKIRYYKPVCGVIIHYIPLKYETLVFIIVDMWNKNNDDISLIFSLPLRLNFHCK